MEAGNIQITKEHYLGIVKLIATTLSVEREDALKLMANVFGSQGRAMYRHLLNISQPNFINVTERLNIAVPEMFFTDLVQALKLVGAQTPICKCGALPIMNEGGAYIVVKEGACPGGCGALIKKAEVVTQRFDWITGLNVPADITVNREANPANPIPITEEGLRNLLKVHPAIDIALKETGVQLIYFCHGWLHHSNYAQRFNGDPGMVLEAIENPRGSGFRDQNEITFAAEKFKVWVSGSTQAPENAQLTLTKLSNKNHTAIRLVLSMLYTDLSDIKRIATEAELDPSQTEVSGSATNSWHSVLTYAFKIGKVPKILQIAKREYGTNPELNNLLRSLA